MLRPYTFPITIANNPRIGQPPSHEKAKEILAGLAGAFIDREVETRGLDYVDRERAKRHARENIEQGYTEDYAN